MKKVAEKFVFLEYFSYLCTINKIRIKYGYKLGQHNKIKED